MTVHHCFVLEFFTMHDDMKVTSKLEIDKSFEVNNNVVLDLRFDLNKMSSCCEDSIP